MTTATVTQTVETQAPFVFTPNATLKDGTSVRVLSAGSDHFGARVRFPSGSVGRVDQREIRWPSN